MKRALCFMIVTPVVTLSACPDEQPPNNNTPADAAIAPDAAEPADAGLPAHAERCARGASLPVIGDMNGDGTTDIADVIALENFVFRGGRAPACRAAADWTNDGRIEADDATTINSYLAAGSQAPRELPEHACDSPMDWPEGQCTSIGFDLLAASRVTASRFTATLAIRSVSLPVQGWSASIVAEDCAIVRVSTDGTRAAEVWDEPPGLRHLGYSVVTAVEGGGVVYTILSTSEDIVLPPGPEGVAVAAIELEQALPASGCSRCTVRVGEGLVWKGQPTLAVIAVGGYAYVPELPSVSIEVCAP